MREGNSWIHLVWIIAVFACVLLAFWWVAERSFDPRFHGKLEPNTYGDSFGFPNAVFSALAFAGVIITLILQMIELKAQRHEMIEMQRVQLLQSRMSFLLDKHTTLRPNEKFELEEIASFIELHVSKYMSDNEILPPTLFCLDVSTTLHEVIDNLERLKQSLEDIEHQDGLSDDRWKHIKKCTPLVVRYRYKVDRYKTATILDRMTARSLDATGLILRTVTSMLSLSARTGGIQKLVSDTTITCLRICEEVLLTKGLGEAEIAPKQVKEIEDAAQNLLLHVYNR